MHDRSTVLYLEAFDPHGDAVRHFLVELERELFADDLRYAEMQVAVGTVLGIEERRRLRQQRRDRGDQRLEVLVAACRHRHDAEERMSGCQFGDERQQELPRLDEVRLAHHRERRAS